MKWFRDSNLALSRGDRMTRREAKRWLAPFAPLNEIALFDFFDQDFFRHDGVSRIHSKKGLLFTTAFIFNEPVKNLGEVFILFVPEERIILKGVISFFQGPHFLNVVFFNRVIIQIIFLMSSGKTPKNLTSGAEKSEFLIKLAADPAFSVLKIFCIV